MRRDDKLSDYLIIISAFLEHPECVIALAMTLIQHSKDKKNANIQLALGFRSVQCCHMYNETPDDG